MPHRFEILDGAIFIADAHENEKRDNFWRFLSDIESKKILPTQLFLMGDMFDLLVGEITATHKFAQKYIDKLEILAKNFPIFYFEGNHDFNLKSLFKNVKIFSFKHQPQTFYTPAGNILLSHGDKYGNFFYKSYTYFIRNTITSSSLNFLNECLKGAISSYIINNQYKKNICNKIDNFEEKILSKLKYYPTENIKAIFEGHYHQNQNFLHENVSYYNFSSFACDKSYFVVQFAPSMKITQFNLRGSNGNNVR